MIKKSTHILWLLSLCLFCHADRQPSEILPVRGQNVDEIIATLEANNHSDLTTHKNILLASRAALKTARVKKSYQQFRTSLNNMIRTYMDEVASRVNDKERSTIADLVKQMQLVMTSTFEGAKKIRLLHQTEWEKREKQFRDGSLDKSEIDAEMAKINELVEEKALEFLSELKGQTDQLRYKLLPFRITLEEHVSADEIDTITNGIVQGAISTLGSVVDTLHRKK